MTTPVSDAIAGPVPAPNRAVVQTQSHQTGSPAAGQDCQRILFEFGPDDHLKSRDLLTKDLEDRFVEPLFPKTDPRRVTARQVRAGPLIDRVLEKGNPRLLPQTMTEQ